MTDTEEYLKKLRTRYRRFFTVDQVIWGFYAASALLPAWGLLTYPANRLFHASAIPLILLVAFFGYASNTMLKQDNPSGRTLGFFVTGSLVITRAALLLYVLTLATKETGGITSELLWGLATPASWVVFLVGFYRLAYHLSAHFYVRVFVNNASNLAFDRTQFHSAPPCQ